MGPLTAHGMDGISWLGGLPGSMYHSLLLVLRLQILCIIWLKSVFFTFSFLAPNYDGKTVAKFTIVKYSSMLDGSGGLQKPACEWAGWNSACLLTVPEVLSFSLQMRAVFFLCTGGHNESTSRDISHASIYNTHTFFSMKLPHARFQSICFWSTSASCTHHNNVQNIDQLGRSHKFGGGEWESRGTETRRCILRALWYFADKTRSRVTTLIWFCFQTHPLKLFHHHYRDGSHLHLRELLATFHPYFNIGSWLSQTIQKRS